MLTTAFKQLRTSLILIILFTLITGLIYPALIAGIAQVFFSWQANGSLIKQNEKFVGSALIGQYFSDPKYFWGRPSATTPFPNNAASSLGSNLGPFNPVLFTTVKNRIDTLHGADPQNQHSIPVDLVTASGSGVDPDISPLAAFYQVPRIAKARNLPESQIQQLVQNSIQNRFLGILGEPRVNVLALNLALDNLGKGTQ